MSNYADPGATRTADLGPCRCPVAPPPHVRDSCDVVVRFGYGDHAEIRQATRRHGVEAGYQTAILLGVKRWTLVLPDGSARPIDAEQVGRLDELSIVGKADKKGELTVIGLMHALGPALELEDPLPNASGAPSPAGPSESASPTLTTPGPPSSTST